MKRRFRIVVVDRSAVSGNCHTLRAPRKRRPCMSTHASSTSSSSKPSERSTGARRVPEKQACRSASLRRSSKRRETHAFVG